MRRSRSLLMTTALMLAGLSLSGCVVVGPRAHRGVWVPGHWASPHVWVEGHWRR